MAAWQYTVGSRGGPCGRPAVCSWQYAVGSMQLERSWYIPLFRKSSRPARRVSRHQRGVRRAPAGRGVLLGGGGRRRGAGAGAGAEAVGGENPPAPADMPFAVGCSKLCAGLDGLLRHAEQKNPVGMTASLPGRLVPMVPTQVDHWLIIVKFVLMGKQKHPLGGRRLSRPFNTSSLSDGCVAR